MEIAPAASRFCGRANTGADGSNAKRKLDTSDPIFSLSVSPSSPSGSPSTTSSKTIPIRPNADKPPPLDMHQKVRRRAASGPPLLSRCYSDGKISKAFGQLLTAEETTDGQCVPNVSALKVRPTSSSPHVLPLRKAVPHAAIRPSTCMHRNPFLNEEMWPLCVSKDSTMIQPAFVTSDCDYNTTSSRLEDSCAMFTPPTPNKRVCSQQGLLKQSKAVAAVSLNNWAPSLTQARKRSLLMSDTADVTDEIPFDKRSSLSIEIDLERRSNAIADALSSRSSTSSTPTNAMLPQKSVSAPKRTYIPPRCRVRNPGNLSLDLSQMEQATFDPRLTASKSSRRRNDQADLCSKVTDFLYIGGVVAAKNKSLLIENGITHVVNCAASVAPATFTNDFCYFNMRLRDHASQDIARHFYSMFDFIERARKCGGRIFLHCLKGISRSPTMAIAYLMWYKNIGMYEALDLIRQARPIVDPNAGFIFQLSEWEQQHPNGKLKFQHTVVFRLEVAYSNHDENGKCNSTASSKSPLFVPVPRVSESFFRDPTKDISEQCLIVACADYMFVWCGTGIKEEHVEVAESGATILQRYEAFPVQSDTVRQGQEPMAFWELIGDEN